MLETILITGGFGYIGRHTCIDLLLDGFKVIIVDSKKIESLEKINNQIFKLTGKKAILYSLRINSKEDLKEIFNSFNIDVVIHCAGIKSVSNFYTQPLETINNELSLICNMLAVMNEFNVKKIIYPSSILVYSGDNEMPLKETSDLNKINPYSKCKIYIEDLLNDLYESDDSWNIIILRYSNTIGMHQSGIIDGYVPKKPDNLTSNIMAFLDQKINSVKLYGDDFDTKDGTCERDYIHIADVARANRACVNYLIKTNLEKPLVLNISSGKPHSVFEVIQEFEDAFGSKIKYEIMPRRPSDVSCSYSGNNLAKKTIQWEPEFKLSDIVNSFI
jgi:UDP-glucose 4-epimerase